MPTRRGLRAGDTVLRHFKLVGCLGRGGMGEVWQAHDSMLGEDIALKLLPGLIRADELAVEDLKNETRRGRQLAHPHIVRVFNFEQDDDNVGIAMELVTGENLAKLRAKQPGTVFSVERITVWVQQLIEALDYAHRTAGVVHRDLKPANLLIESATQTLKIADFGIARCLAESMQRVTVSAQSRGTLCYMSPEQAIGRGANPLDDLYAVGATLYELLAGSPPFYQGDVYTQIQKVPPQSIAQRLSENGIQVSPPPPAWEAAIIRCLAKQRVDRPQSAGEIAEMLGLRGAAHITPYVAAPTMPPVAHAPATESVIANSAVTGSVAISTSAPMVSVSATEQQTQRSFIDLTRTASQHATPAAKRPSPGKAETRRPSSITPMVVGAVVAVVLLGGGLVGWQWFQRGLRKTTGQTTPVDGKKNETKGDKGGDEQSNTPVNLPPKGEDWNVPSVFFSTIAAAIEAAPPGQTIRIGNKRWNEHLRVSKPVHLIGSDQEQTVIAMDGGKGSVIEINGAPGVVIESLSIEHEGTAVVASGPPLMRVESSTITLRRCLFIKSAGDGVVAGDKGNIIAEECRFEQNAQAGVRAGLGGLVSLKNSKFRANDIAIYAGGDQAKITIEGGEFQSHGHHGIEVASAGQLKLKNVKILDCSESGCFVHDPGSKLDATDVTISKCKEGTKVTDGASVTLINCRHESNTIGVGARNPGALTFNGGSASGNSLHGLAIEADRSAGSVLISGMTIKSNAQVGLFVGGADVKPDVSGNDFGPNGLLDVLVRDGAGGRFAKNTLRTGPDFKDYSGGSPDWQPDNQEITGQGPK